MEAKRILDDLSPKAYEHPGDRAALTVLRGLPGLDRLVAMLINVTSGKRIRLLFLGGSVKAGEKQFPRIYSLMKECSGILGMPVPEVFVTQSPVLNAGTYGVDVPFVIVNSSMLSVLDDIELATVLGHELAHIKSGHVLYKTLLWLISNIGVSALGALGGLGAQAALAALVAALREWDRKSELTSDRGGLLCVQDPDASFRLLMKLAGGSHVGEMNINEFFLQADEYEKGGDVIDSVHKLMNLIQLSHPFPVLRLKELKMWVDGGNYQDILNGSYQRQSDSKEEPFRDIFEAAEEYRNEFEKSEDPLTMSIRDFGKNIEKAARDAGKEVDSFLQSFFPDAGNGGGN